MKFWLGDEFPKAIPPPNAGLQGPDVNERLALGKMNRKGVGALSLGPSTHTGFTPVPKEAAANLDCNATLLAGAKKR